MPQQGTRSTNAYQIVDRTSQAYLHYTCGQNPGGEMEQSCLRGRESLSSARNLRKDECHEPAYRLRMTLDSTSVAYFTDGGPRLVPDVSSSSRSPIVPSLVAMIRTFGDRRISTRVSTRRAWSTRLKVAGRRQDRGLRGRDGPGVNSTIIRRLRRTQEWCSSIK